MPRFLVWYTLENGHGDSMEVETDTRDAAADWVMDNLPEVDSIDNVEQMG